MLKLFIDMNRDLAVLNFTAFFKCSDLLKHLNLYPLNVHVQLFFDTSFHQNKNILIHTKVFFE